MDAERFDTLLRSLSMNHSRRRALRLLAGSALGGLLGRRESGPGEAHDLLGKCKKKSGEAKKKCLKKAKKHAAQHASETVPPPPPRSRPTCAKDGVKNGSESDIDCGGGICPRCGPGLKCNSRNDCITARCHTGGCQQCSFDSTAPCGTDASGAACACRDFLHNGLTFRGCYNTAVAATTVDSCAQCPPDSLCKRDAFSAFQYNCLTPCRAKTPCSAVGALCNPNDPAGRDVDCCQGTCTACNVNGDECFCQPV